MSIHPTAIIEKGAELDSTADIGPYAIIGPHVRIGPGTSVGSHAVIEGHTTIGARNKVFHHAAVGQVPPDLKYRGEPTQLVIGDENTIREFTTLHIGTEGGGGVTTIGSRNLFMSYSHVAHDCFIGSGCILANQATLAGHVHIADEVTVGGLAAIHQFTRIGRNAFIGGGSMVVMDVLSYCTVSGDRAELTGLNTVGLTRHGFTAEQIARIKEGYRILFRSKLSLNEAVSQLKAEMGQYTEIQEMLTFLAGSTRGLTR